MAVAGKDQLFGATDLRNNGAVSGHRSAHPPSTPPAACRSTPGDRRASDSRRTPPACARLGKPPDRQHAHHPPRLLIALLERRRIEAAAFRPIEIRPQARHKAAAHRGVCASGELHAQRIDHQIELRAGLSVAESQPAVPRVPVTSRLAAISAPAASAASERTWNSAPRCTASPDGLVPRPAPDSAHPAPRAPMAAPCRTAARSARPSRGSRADANRIQPRQPHGLQDQSRPQRPRRLQPVKHHHRVPLRAINAAQASPAMPQPAMAIDSGLMRVGSGAC